MTRRTTTLFVYIPCCRLTIWMTQGGRPRDLHSLSQSISPVLKINRRFQKIKNDLIRFEAVGRGNVILPPISMDVCTQLTVQTHRSLKTCPLLEGGFVCIDQAGICWEWSVQDSSDLCFSSDPVVEIMLEQLSERSGLVGSGWRGFRCMDEFVDHDLKFFFNGQSLSASPIFRVRA